MKITGIICEYNPLHLGHKKQIDLIREVYPDGGIVCLMSGNFVQRGTPAIFDRSVRAKAAILSGADLVLELPVTASLCSAEGFADNGVRILSSICDNLCFGAETADTEILLTTAQALLSPAFSLALRKQLESGLSFPAARQATLNNLGINAEHLSFPNNILAVEYCKAILSQGSKMTPFPIFRQGDYHDPVADPQNPSATSLRQIPVDAWKPFVPAVAADCYEGASVHQLQAGERSILTRLRTMTDAEFEALPFSSEGLWRKLMHAAREKSSLEEIVSAVKSKRYTRTRIDRMIMCAFLGLTAKDLVAPAPYVRVLAFNKKGRSILNTARESGRFPNIGEKSEHPYQQIEDRCNSLYGLFSVGTPDPPDCNSRSRVFSYE